MSQGWENLKPAPIEFMHAKLLNLFHEFRKNKTDSTNVEMCGMAFSRIVVAAKVATLEEYPNENLQLPIPKTFEEGNANAAPNSLEVCVFKYCPNNPRCEGKCSQVK